MVAEPGSTRPDAIEDYKHQASIIDARVEGVERFISEPDVGDLVGTKGSLTANETLAAKLAESLHNQSSEREPRRRSRVEEILAIHETIKLLNDDGAFNVFKNSSLVQVFQNTFAVVRRTMDELRRSYRMLSNLAFT